MKRTRFWMLGAFVVVTAALVGVTLKVHDSPLYQLSRYPKTPAFQRYLFYLSGEMENPISGTNSTLLSVDEPLDGDFNTVLQYKISPGLQFDLNTLSYGTGSSRSGRTSSMNAQQQAKIRRLISQLPPSLPTDKRENLLVVLFYKANLEELRLYDARTPPTQVREIARILTQIVDKENHALLPGQAPPDDVPHLRSPLLKGSLNSQRAVN